MGVVDLNAINVSKGATFITHIPELKRAKKHATNGKNPIHVLMLIPSKKRIWGSSSEYFVLIFELGWPNGVNRGLDGTTAIFTRKKHTIVRVTPMSLQSGESRSLQHCHFRQVPVPQLTANLQDRQDPYRINLFGET